MNFYTLALFMYVRGAIGIFSGLGTWVFGVAALRRVQRVEQVRLVAAVIRASGNLVVGSIVVLGIAGFSMAVTVWGIRATWIIVATISFALLAPGGLLVLDPHVRATAKQAREAPDGLLPVALAARMRDPVLGTGLSFYVACLFGIVFLMTNKPALSVGVLAMVIAVAAGFLARLPLWRSARIRRRHDAASRRRA